MIEKLQEEIKLGNVSSEELFSNSNTLAHNYQDDFNSFVTIVDKYKSRSRVKNLLSGIPYALKDNFSTSGILTTASSNILKDYIPVYDATVYKKLKRCGAVLVGKTVLDELAMGGTGTTASTGVVRNPYDKERLIGGSSAGSAACVSLGIVPYSIGSDTGDSVRKPASFGGIVGFKPTYGRISRYGLFGFASSMDHVGIFSKTVRDSCIVTDYLKGEDPLDMTSLVDDNKCYLDTIDKDITGKKLFYIKEICDISNYDSSDKDVIKTLTDFNILIDKCRESGFIVEEVSIDKTLLSAIYPTYMCISCAEATSNNANLTGISFGPRSDGNNIEEIMFNARTKGFSEFIKRRFILGSYILQKENQEKLFLNAQRVRRMIVDKFNSLFDEYDGFILPASGSCAPRFDDSSEKLSDRYLILENHLAIANFGGFPSITIPFTKVNGLSVGVNITSKALSDDVLLNMSNKLEEIIDYKEGDLDV